MIYINICVRNKLHTSSVSVTKVQVDSQLGKLFKNNLVPTVKDVLRRSNIGIAYICTLQADKLENLTTMEHLYFHQKFGMFIKKPCQMVIGLIIYLKGGIIVLQIL